MAAESPAQRARRWLLLCVLHTPCAVCGCVVLWGNNPRRVKISFTWLSQGRVGDRRFGGALVELLELELRLPRTS
jgi:hypothetical protein